MNMIVVCVKLVEKTSKSIKEKMRKSKMGEFIEALVVAFLTFVVVWLLLFANEVNAQNVKRQGKTFVEQAADTTNNCIKGKVYETDLIYVDKQGNAYPIYLSSNGNAFIIKVSKKSGNKYRKYLPEITKQLNNERKNK